MKHMIWQVVETHLPPLLSAMTKSWCERPFEIDRRQFTEGKVLFGVLIRSSWALAKKMQRVRLEQLLANEHKTKSINLSLMLDL